jgi:hypothetical protein
VSSGATSGEDFATQYKSLSDDALIQLASEGGLRSEADVALRAEMRQRSIGPREVRSLRAEQMKTKLQLEVSHNPYSYRGSGLQLRGHKFLNELDKNREIYVVTRWVVFSFLPVVPLGSYRVKSIAEDSARQTFVGKVKLQWDQVASGWMQTGSVVILLWCVWLWLRWWLIRHQ